MTETVTLVFFAIAFVSVAPIAATLWPGGV